MRDFHFAGEGVSVYSDPALLDKHYGNRDSELYSCPGTYRICQLQRFSAACAADCPAFGGDDGAEPAGYPGSGAVLAYGRNADLYV